MTTIESLCELYRTNIDLICLISGWVGSFMLAFCSVPQAVQTLRTRNVDGLSLQMMYMWLFGCIFALIFGLHTRVPPQVLVSYISNIVSASVIITCIYLWRKPKVPQA